jgi:hypothetical protein
MVAEAEVLPAKIPVKGRDTSKGQISLTTRAKVRNLYVVQMLPAKEVAAECGITPIQVYKLAERHAWSSIRKERIGKLSAPLQAREEEQCEEINRAAAMLSDQGLLGSLMRANEAAESRAEFASKDCQAFASAARSLMQIGRTLRGLDGPAAAAKGDTNNIVFIGQLVTATQAASAPAEKRVEPSAPPVTQVASEA